MNIIVRITFAFWLILDTNFSYPQEVLLIPAASTIQSEDWTVRRYAFAKLTGQNKYSSIGSNSIPLYLQQIFDEDPDSADIRKSGLISLLEAENRNIADKEKLRLSRGLAELPVNERFTEEYTEYYAEVIAAVAYINDPGSLTALVGAITTGNMAINAVEKFGVIAIGPVADLLANADERKRSTAALVLGRLMENSAVMENASALTTVKSVAMKAAQDESPLVRRNIIKVLVMLDDPESISVVRDLSINDPYQADYLDNKPYIVRKAAIEALAKIQP